MPNKIQLRRGTAGQWDAANPTLLNGELGYETDTKRFKIGDGVSLWRILPYGSADSDNQDLLIIMGAV